MADYTFPLMILLGFTANYLMLYQKNRLMYGVIFLALAGTSIYMTYGTHKEYMLFTYILLAIGIISFLYDHVHLSDKKRNIVG